jgi:hypothetical protein
VYILLQRADDKALRDKYGFELLFMSPNVNDFAAITPDVFRLASGVHNAPPGLPEALAQLAVFAGHVNAIEDCHMGNFMRRGDQLVFNDALAGVDSSQRLQKYRKACMERWERRHSRKAAA